MKMPGKKMKLDVVRSEEHVFNSPANHGSAGIPRRDEENTFRTGMRSGIPTRTEEHIFTPKKGRSGKARLKGGR